MAVRGTGSNAGQKFDQHRVGEETIEELRAARSRNAKKQERGKAGKFASHNSLAIDLPPAAEAPSSQPANHRDPAYLLMTPERYFAKNPNLSPTISYDTDD